MNPTPDERLRIIALQEAMRHNTIPDDIIDIAQKYYDFLTFKEELKNLSGNDAISFENSVRR